MAKTFDPESNTMIHPYPGPGITISPYNEGEADSRIDYYPEEDNWKHRSTNMRCHTCMFFVRKERLAPMQVGQPWPGRCRRRAPTMAGWPAVFDTDWCGSHKIDENKI